MECFLLLGEEYRTALTFIGNIIVDKAGEIH
nr:MAG TPA: hypothetical protein [Caudoviricetes sp.]